MYDTSQIQLNTKYQVRERYNILMRVASGLFAWNMVAELLAFSSRQFSLTINRGPFPASHYFFFLSKSAAGGVCRPRSEAPCTAYTVPRVLAFPTHSIPSRQNQLRVFPSTATKSAEST